MMNKKSIAIATLFLSIVTCAFCTEEITTGKKSFFSDIHFSLSPYAQILYGNQYESVYNKQTAVGNRLLSQLVWDQKPLYIGGFKIETGYKDFFINGSIQSALPLDCGIVMDSDWLNVQSFYNCPDDIAAIKTNYTESTSKIELYYEFSTQLGYTFKVDSKCSLTPFAELNYSYSSYYAMGCTGTYYNTMYKESNGYYGQYDDDDHSYSVFHDDTVATMRLQRNCYFTWAGIIFNYQPTDKLSTQVSCAISTFDFIQSLDSHLLRDYYFLDIMKGYLNGAKVSTGVSYSLTKKQSLSAKIDGLFLGESSGKDYVRKSADGSFYEDSTVVAGCNFVNVTATIAYKYSFN